MMNIGKMMKQVTDMQSKMTEMQSRLGDVYMTGQAASGKVTVMMNGRAELHKVTIAPELMDASEKDMLEDLIVVACNDAKAQVEAYVAKETEGMMGGLKLPAGIKLPF